MPNMKILHGVDNIGGMAGVLAGAQRELGYDAWSYCNPTGNFEFHADRTLAATTRLGKAAELARFLLFEERGFDCFHFYSSRSLSGNLLVDVPWLKRMGRRVFFYFCGCDIRHRETVLARHKYNACAGCPSMACAKNQAKARRIALEYADAIFVSTPDLLEFVPRAILLPQPMDLGRLDGIVQTLAATTPPGRPSSARAVRVCHAPSDRTLKGTDRIMDAIDRLKGRGVKVELVLIENMSHAEALAVSATCDIAVDQLLIGAYGQYAAEAMALGKPTICYIREDLRGLYDDDCPIISADPDDFEDVLAEWIAHTEWWDGAGSAGRAYVTRVHDRLTVAQRCIDCYHEGHVREGEGRSTRTA